uniref:Uncharacterized protein n=1 Tax=Knipowitschia caucasica TaxID=637954 RepID=A0AAV2LXE7_KNICA
MIRPQVNTIAGTLKNAQLARRTFALQLGFGSQSVVPTSGMTKDGRSVDTAGRQDIFNAHAHTKVPQRQALAQVTEVSPSDIKGEQELVLDCIEPDVVEVGRVMARTDNVSVEDGETWRERQAKDPELVQIRQWKEQGTTCPEARGERSLADLPRKDGPPKQRPDRGSPQAALLLAKND